MYSSDKPCWEKLAKPMAFRLLKDEQKLAVEYGNVTNIPPSTSAKELYERCLSCKNYCECAVSHYRKPCNFEFRGGDNNDGSLRKRR